MTTRRTDSDTAGARWLILIHHLRPKPDYLRVKVGRRLKGLGAVAIKNSVYVLPSSSEARAAFSGLVREIQREGGTAVAGEARFIEGLSDRAVEDLFRAARDREYADISEQARRFANLPAGKGAPGRRQRDLTSELARLKRRFLEAASKDRFGARSRETTAALLARIEDRLQGVDENRGLADPPRPPKGATWITRTGVMVDRIASAWLIRRFIDPQARFKFVSGRGYRPKRGEIRFDMAGAEYTHQGDRCTFEVLLEHFQLREPPLRPIAEIVHDIDLEDGKYGRPETPGVARLIIGLAIARTLDDVRIQQGAVLFNNLYESFRTRA